MDITHLHLHTRDRARSEAFYRDRFGLATCKTAPSLTFMKGERDFLLVLKDDAAPEPAPSWFHFGMKMESREAVRTKREQLLADGVDSTTPMREEPDITAFRCSDPDGYAIEVYWLPD